MWFVSLSSFGMSYTYLHRRMGKRDYFDFILVLLSHEFLVGVLMGMSFGYPPLLTIAILHASSSTDLGKLLFDGMGFFSLRPTAGYHTLCE